MQLDRNGMEVLDREESLRLLEAAPIGRVIITLGALPAAFPVNFAMLDGDVVFRTSAGTKLQAAVRHAVVAFEVDAFDSLGHTGWSVLVTGRAEPLAADDLARAEHLPLQPWLPSDPAEFVRIRAEIVSGRRLGIESRAAYHRPADDDALSAWKPAVSTCPACGCDRLLGVSDGESANFVCTGCAACWRVEAGWMRRVTPTLCPGCDFKPACSRAYLADALRLERTGERR